MEQKALIQKLGESTHFYTPSSVSCIKINSEYEYQSPSTKQELLDLLQLWIDAEKLKLSPPKEPIKEPKIGINKALFFGCFMPGLIIVIALIIGHQFKEAIIITALVLIFLLSIKKLNHKRRIK
jgi:hypothetical protein